MYPALYDTFNGPNGTALAAHIPDVGGPWVDDNAGLQIQGNALIAVLDPTLSHSEVLQRQMTLDTLVNFNGMPAGCDLLLRITDDAIANFMWIKVFGDGSGEFRVRVAGVDVILWTVPAGYFNVAGSHRIKIKAGLAYHEWWYDQQLACIVPRLLARTFNFQRFTIGTTGLGGGPSPILRSLAAY